MAERDLAKMVEYLGPINPAATRRLLAKVKKLTKKLAAGKFEGREVELSTGELVRRWPVPPLVVYYKRTTEALDLVRVYHSSRDPLEP